jgi:hypothetical protein
MAPEDKQALDVLAASFDGATELALTAQGVSRDALARLTLAGYLRQDTELFARSRGTTGARFYLTAAGRRARDRVTN